jgi:hypothetical protein
MTGCLETRVLLHEPGNFKHARRKGSESGGHTATHLAGCLDSCPRAQGDNTVSHGRALCLRNDDGHRDGRNAGIRSLRLRGRLSLEKLMQTCEGTIRIQQMVITVQLGR